MQKVSDEAELKTRLTNALQNNDRMLVQKAVTGADYRVIVLDGEILAIIERRPLSIMGNGANTIADLFAEKIKTLTTRSGGYKIEADDPRILKAIHEAGYDVTTILSSEQRLNLLSNANLSTGGEAVDVTDLASPGFKALAVEAARVCGLRYAGVDILCDDLSKKGCPANVLELNAGPGLTNFWQAAPHHHQRVRSIYRRVLEAMLESA